MKNIFLGLMSFALLVSCGSGNNKINDKNNILNSTIDTVLIKKHLYTLASNEMQGRGSGTQGIELAAQYIESEYSELGLETFENYSTYRQEFRESEMDLFNVIGVLPGKSSPEEFVVISAHYDHLGIVNKDRAVSGDSIANGADDDASGTSAIMALARYWKDRGDNARSIVFVAFTAEEKGLIGSTYFGQTIDPAKVVAGINIEMIGKPSTFGPNTAWLTGFDRSDFGTIIQKNLIGTEYKLYPDPYPDFRLFFRSDNASLARLGVPAHTFSSGPIDQDPYYHTVDDEVETLDMQLITNTVRAVALGTESIIMGIDTPSRIVLKEN